MKKSVQSKVKVYYEIGFSVLLIINALLLVYFILKLNQIESLARDTQAQAQEIIKTIK